MPTDLYWNPEINRRIGGLENNILLPHRRCFINRRIGGLEITSARDTEYMPINRRIGGLETTGGVI